LIAWHQSPVQEKIAWQVIDENRSPDSGSVHGLIAWYR
jgi:hypothetical protein